jgi:hypothetical protein
MTTQLKKQAAPGKTPEAEAGELPQLKKQGHYTMLDWFVKQGAHFVRVAAWNAKVNAPGKQPIDKAWQVKPLDLKDVMPHIQNGGNVGMLCGKLSGGLCCLTLTITCRNFLNTSRA